MDEELNCYRFYFQNPGFDGSSLVLDIWNWGLGFETMIFDGIS